MKEQIMKVIDFFYQGEGVREVGHIEVDARHNFLAVKELLRERHGFEGDILLFLEDCDEPVDETLIIETHSGSCGIKAHLHRCRHVEVSVTFNNETVHHSFGPGTTIARVKRWAAETKFGMSREDASEHVLQLIGGHDRPAPGTHLGALVSCHACKLAFHLVPDERVNGYPGPEVRV
jgi:hypothetical protein